MHDHQRAPAETLRETADDHRLPETRRRDAELLACATSGGEHLGNGFLLVLPEDERGHRQSPIRTRACVATSASSRLSAVSLMYMFTQPGSRAVSSTRHRPS